MKPRKIGVLYIDDREVEVFAAEDPDGDWVAYRLADTIIVRALDTAELEMAVARSFLRPRAV